MPACTYASTNNKTRSNQMHIAVQSSLFITHISQRYWKSIRQIKKTDIAGLFINTTCVRRGERDGNGNGEMKPRGTLTRRQNNFSLIFFFFLFFYKEEPCNDGMDMKKSQTQKNNTKEATFIQIRVSLSLFSFVIRVFN